jgi:recombinational DNA repair ATPase RecF
MIVLKEILEWSQDRPDWQRDALRRLVLEDELSDDDYYELTEICKSNHGLADKQDFNPIAKEHIPNVNPNLEKVTLVSIFHYRGVNALAENQSLTFSKGLTIIYGDNAAGKTGYIRILKKVCRARRQEQILGNIKSGEKQIAPEVTIKYKVGEEEEPREWSGEERDEDIVRISVFDSQCATVYLTEKTDVAFRPFGLDLFDKLVQACKTIRGKLESEKDSYALSLIEELKKQVPEETSVAKFLSKISILTKPEQVNILAQLSDEEKERLEGMEKILVDLQAKNPAKLVSHLKLLERRVRALHQHLEEIEKILSDEAVENILDLKNELNIKSDEAIRLRNAAFQEDVLDGTGTDLWLHLWESARRFSQEIVYTGRHFPVVGEGARCVLCQQNLNSHASSRLEQFEAFVSSTIEKELRKDKVKLDQLLDSIRELEITNAPTSEILEELSIENDTISDFILLALKNNENRQKATVKALDANIEFESDYPALAVASNKVNMYADQLVERINVLQGNQTDEKMNLLNKEIQELRARLILQDNIDVVLNEIERMKKIAAYSLCIDETNTYTITQKSSAVTKTVVTNKLKKSFQDELLKLSFRQVAVELEEVGGADGVFYHKLILNHAPKVDLPKIASEGEQRCLSIAAFFAELSTAEDLSGIIFDDPVSSLDYKWREAVARRLIDESKQRQVIVFTHDIVFLLLLKQYSEEQDVEQLDQYVCQLSIGPGVCTQDLPWVALKVSRRISYLNKKLQEVDKLYRDGDQESYEREAGLIYGRLREAWERGVEEVLLGGIIERFRNNVQTQQIAQIADITEEDCKTVENAMAKCSKWLIGHDQAAAARADIPEPSELREDIEILDTWVKSIRRRRNKS